MHVSPPDATDGSLLVAPITAPNLRWCKGLLRSDARRGQAFDRQWQAPPCEWCVMTLLNLAAQIDDLHVEHQGVERRWVVVHTRTGLVVVHGYPSRKAAYSAANDLRTRIDWASLHQIAVPAMPGRPAELRWRLGLDARITLRDEQARLVTS